MYCYDQKLSAFMYLLYGKHTNVFDIRQRSFQSLSQPNKYIVFLIQYVSFSFLIYDICWENSKNQYFRLSLISKCKILTLDGCIVMTFLMLFCAGNKQFFNNVICIIISSFFQVVGVANIWDSIPWSTILDQIDVTPSHKLPEKKSTKSRSATIWHCPTAIPGKEI